MTPEGPEAPKPLSITDKLKNLFNQAVDAIKKSVEERKDIDPAADLVTVPEESKEDFEAPKEIFEKDFDLGDFEITEKEVPDLKPEAVYLLLGSVDRMAFKEVASRQRIKVERYGENVNWYNAAQMDATVFLQYKDQIETNFPTLTDPARRARILEVIQSMSEMTEFTDKAWKDMIKAKGYKSDEVYGSEGAYNLLLAFQRSVGTVQREMLVDENLKAEGEFLPMFTVRLEIATKEGKTDSARFAKLIEVVKKEKPEEEDEEDLDTDLDGGEPGPVVPLPQPEPAPEPAPVPPEPAPAPPEPAPEPPEEKESPDAEKLGKMVEELTGLGFELAEAPTNFGDNVYAKYGEKRVLIIFVSEGIYNFSMLNTPENVTVGVSNVDGQAMKTALDAQQHANKVEAMKLDLEHVAGFNATVEGPLAKDADGDDYDPNTYKVTLKGLIYTNPGTGDVSNPFDVKFIVRIDEKRGYVDAETVAGTRLKKADDPKALYEEAGEKGFKEQKIEKTP